MTLNFSYKNFNIERLMLPQPTMAPQTFWGIQMPPIFNFFNPFSFQTFNLDKFNQSIDNLFNWNQQADTAPLTPQTNYTGQLFDSNNFMNFSYTPTFNMTPMSYMPPPPTLSGFDLPTANQFDMPRVEPLRMPEVPSYNYTKKKVIPAPRTNHRIHIDKMSTLEDIMAVYDPKKGARYASEMKKEIKHSKKGHCAESIKNGAVNANLGGYVHGHAYMTPEIFSKNSNFKLFRVPGYLLGKLPQGCTLCYAPGDCGYSPVYGHNEVTDGKGGALHFGYNPKIKESDNVIVCVPV